MSPRGRINKNKNPPPILLTSSHTTWWHRSTVVRGSGLKTSPSFSVDNLPSNAHSHLLAEMSSNDSPNSTKNTRDPPCSDPKPLRVDNRPREPCTAPHISPAHMPATGPEEPEETPSGVMEGSEEEPESSLIPSLSTPGLPWFLKVRFKGKTCLLIPPEILQSKEYNDLLEVGAEFTQEDHTYRILPYGFGFWGTNGNINMDDPEIPEEELLFRARLTALTGIYGRLVSNYKYCTYTRKFLAQQACLTIVESAKETCCVRYPFMNLYHRYKSRKCVHTMQVYLGIPEVTFAGNSAAAILLDQGVITSDNTSSHRCTESNLTETAFVDSIEVETIPLPTLKDPFNVHDDANEGIDKILSNIQNYYNHHSNCDRVCDFHCYKDVKKGELTLQLQLHEDVPTASHISKDELNTIGGINYNKKSVQAYGSRSLE
ncbi:hypothetical protein BU17DRAFT_70418 [Hysterangium stoloniferum]|nr:hypothetical protein BU17DRAFT_70418 [Hysterangium stoloniferum]